MDEEYHTLKLFMHQSHTVGAALEHVSWNQLLIRIEYQTRPTKSNEEDCKRLRLKGHMVQHISSMNERRNIVTVFCSPKNYRKVLTDLEKDFCTIIGIWKNGVRFPL